MRTTADIWLKPALLAAVTLAAAAVASAQEVGPVFPTVLVVEHSLTRIEADGESFTTDPVTDTYGGSWVVSERPDGSRLVIDFVRREITEIRPAEGRYWVIGFERFAQLLRELHALETGGAPAKQAETPDVMPELRVEEIHAARETPAKSRPETGSLLDRPQVRHLRVSRKGAEGREDERLVDLWFDPGLTLGRRALDLLDEFERDVLGASAGLPARLGQAAVALARREAGGALAIVTIRQTGPDGARIEDAAIRIETREIVPTDLVVVPEGLQRAPHPLELLVAHEKREAELNLLMGGEGRQ